MQANPVPSVSEKTKQGTEATGPTGWAWVEAGVWAPRMMSALANGVKGGKWSTLIDKVYAPQTLAIAWQKVKANRGAAGVDGQSIERFEARASQYLDELSQVIREGTYCPQAAKRVGIPKGRGKTRPLGIPTVKERIVQQAVRLVIGPIFEAEFRATSYGFRPGRGCHDALRRVDALIQQGYTHVVDADLASYFDTIPHGALMARVEAHISDGHFLKLVRSWLKADILQGMARWTPTHGTPQGAVLDPLLANLYLHPLDTRMAERGYQMVRYADDFVILCRSAGEAQTALQEATGWVTQQGLSLHPDKTQTGGCRESGQGFDFLGYRFEAGKRTVRKKSLKQLEDRIREKTKRTQGRNLGGVIADLNPMLRGWFNYFKHAHRYTFEPLDGFIRRRLRAILRKQEKRPGRGQCRAGHQRWPNAYFAEAGLFAFHTAWQIAGYSRWGNNRLGSRVRENRTHGSEGGEANAFPTPIRCVSFIVRGTAHLHIL